VRVALGVGGVDAARLDRHFHGGSGRIFGIEADLAVPLGEAATGLRDDHVAHGEGDRGVTGVDVPDGEGHLRLLKGL